MAFLRSLEILYPCDGCVGPTGEQNGFIMCATLQPKHVTSVERVKERSRGTRFERLIQQSVLECVVMTDFNVIERDWVFVDRKAEDGHQFGRIFPSFWNS